MAKFVNNQASDGAVLGVTVSDKIGFYGITTPVVQLSGLVLVTNATPTVTAFGFTSAQAGDILSAVRFMYSVMAGMNLAR